MKNCQCDKHLVCPIASECHHSVPHDPFSAHAVDCRIMFCGEAEGIKDGFCVEVSDEIEET